MLAREEMTVEQDKHYLQILEELRRPLGLLGTSSRLVKALADLREFRPDLILKAATHLLADRSREVQLAAETTVELALRDIVESQFDTGVDQGFWEWHRVKPAAVSGISPENHRNLLRFLTYSKSGYVREQALLRLLDRSHPLDWPFALERLGDWVPEVRSVATQLVTGLLALEAEAELGRWPKRISALARIEFATTMQPVFLPLIQRLGASGELAKSWSSFSREYRRLALRYLLEEPFPPTELVETVLQNDDVAAIKLVLNYHVLSDRQFSGLLSHWSPQAKNAALQALPLISPADEEAILLRALTDTFGRVRKTAQMALTKRGLDPRAIYLGLLDSPEPARSTVEGFCEVATGRDLDRLRFILANGKPRERLAAAKTLIGLVDEESLVRMLTDASGRIRRLALAYVVRNPLSLDPDARRELFRASENGVRRTAGLLLMHTARWQSIAWILQFLSDGDEDLRGMANSHLASWIRWASRSPSVPGSEVFGTAWQTFEENRRAIPEGMNAELESILGWVGRQAGMK